MTGNEMITSLGYRLEDTGHVNFASAQKLVALNDAQRQAVSMLTNDALVHLQQQEDLDTVDADNDDDNFGQNDFFTLPGASDPLMNRIVKAYDNTNNRFIEMVSPAGFKEGGNYSYGTLGTIMANRLYVSTKDDPVTSCQIIYIGSPANIADNSNEIEYFSDSVQQVIVELAEALLWRQDNRQNRATAAANNAAAMIQTINASGV